MSSPLDLNPTYEVTKAFLFLRTASTAVTNLRTQIESTKAYIQWNLVNRYYNEHMANEAQLGTDERELKSWETRLVHVGAVLVNWTAKVKTGKWLPAGIVGIIGEMLYSSDLDLPRIW